jgi:hypothetical protein
MDVLLDVIAERAPIFQVSGPTRTLVAQATSVIGSGYASASTHDTTVAVNIALRSGGISMTLADTTKHANTLCTATLVAAIPSFATYFARLMRFVASAMNETANVMPVSVTDLSISRPGVRQLHAVVIRGRERRQCSAAFREGVFDLFDRRAHFEHHVSFEVPHRRDRVAHPVLAEGRLPPRGRANRFGFSGRERLRFADAGTHLRGAAHDLFRRQLFHGLAIDPGREEELRHLVRRCRGRVGENREGLLEAEGEGLVAGVRVDDGDEFAGLGLTDEAAVGEHRFERGVAESRVEFVTKEFAQRFSDLEEVFGDALLAT